MGPHVFWKVISNLAKLQRRGRNFQRLKLFCGFLLPSSVTTKWIYQDVNFLENLSGDAIEYWNGSPLETSGIVAIKFELKESEVSFQWRFLCRCRFRIVPPFAWEQTFERETTTGWSSSKWHWRIFPLFLQMQQLGNMKDNFDDLSDPEQFACLVNARQFVFINIKKKILRLRGIVCFRWSTSSTV